MLYTHPPTEEMENGNSELENQTTFVKTGGFRTAGSAQSNKQVCVIGGESASEGLAGHEAPRNVGEDGEDGMLMEEAQAYRLQYSPVSSKGFGVVLCSYQFCGLWGIRERWGEIVGRKRSLENIAGGDRL